MKRYEDCFNPDSMCGSCSLSSRGRDCHNNNINRLLYYRSLASITQSQLADVSGVNIRQIQRYENATSDLGNMTLRNAVAISKALGCQPDDLI